MTDIPQAWVEKAAQVLSREQSRGVIAPRAYLNDARAVLAAVADDIRLDGAADAALALAARQASEPAVEREALADGCTSEHSPATEPGCLMRPEAAPGNDAMTVAWEWPCDNYQAPHTCLTAPSSQAARCDFCRAQADAVLPDVRRELVVDREALVRFFHNEGDGGIWEAFDRDAAETLTDAVLASGVVQDAADVRRAERERVDEVEEAAQGLVDHLSEQHAFWQAEAQRRADTYSLVHRDLYRYYAKDAGTPTATLRAALARARIAREVATDPTEAE